MNIFTEIGILRKQIQVIYEFITQKGEEKMFNVSNLQNELDRAKLLVEKAINIIKDQTIKINDLTNTVSNQESVISQHNEESLAVQDLNNKANELTDGVHATLSELEGFLNKYDEGNVVTTPPVETPVVTETVETPSLTHTIQTIIV